MLPTTQAPVFNPTPTLIGIKGWPSSSASTLRISFKLSICSSMSSAGFAGVELMLDVVERRIPERHDGVAHIFVDVALSRQDHVGQRGQEAVHQRRQALRIVLEGFGDGGETADVGKT